MAFIIKDRVKEGTTSTGTGDITLSGSLATFDTFQSYMTNGDTTYYAIVHTSSGVDEWEVGLGTWNTGNTLTRTTVLAGSNGTSAENFSAGSKDVFMTYPAAHAALAGDDVDFANITVTGTVDGRDVATDGSKLDTVEQNADVTDAINVAAAGALMKSGGTMTGNLILNGDPTVALGAATKEYVDTIAAAGIHYHTPVRVEAPLNLTVTYNNGASGVGATLTNAGTQEAITIDGVALSSGDRVLVYEQTDATQNGIYTVTTVGSGSTNWVLTRATDADSYGASDPNALGEGDAYFVKEGATGAGELYVMNTAGTITFGTTNITFTVIAETAVYSAGTGLTLTGTTFAIGQDVGTTANVTFNQVTAAIIGNVTGNVTGDLTGNADTATALATARTVQLSGDVTGSATFDGSANINITAAVQDDSHAHVISNVDGLQTALNGKTTTARTITAGDGLTGGGDLTANRTLNVGAGSGITVTADAVSHADTSSQGSSNNSGRTYIQDVTLDTFGHVTGLATATETVTDTTYTAGAGLNLSGTVFSHTDTSSQASVNNSNGTVIQDITLDGFGHITSLASVNLDGRYYTETEADSRFVNVTGDTMTGNLTMGTNWIYMQYSGSDLLRMNAAGDRFDFYNQTQARFTDVRARSFVRSDGNVSFHDDYHPNADKWTTARTLSLSGEATGSVSWDGSANANLSVTLNHDALNDQYVQQLGDASSPNYQTPSSRRIDPNTDNPTNEHYAVVTYGNGGNVTGQLATHFQSGATYNRAYNSSWSAWSRMFDEDYHPNADKWTTARTLSLTGDVTGSVSWDGSGNASLSTDWRGGTANANVNMNNFSITNANHLTFNDPGPTEGIEWLGGNGWRIVESPDDLTTNSGGNLQFVESSTRRMTLKTNGDLDIVGGNLSVDINKGITNSGGWTRNTTPYGYIEFGPANASWGHIYTDRPAFYFNKELYVNNSKVWNAGNDGSGSGLDADLLDGVQGSSFLRSDVADTATKISFGTGNVQAPSPTDSSTGARLILYPNGSGRDYALGIESSTMWFNSDDHYKWYVDGSLKFEWDNTAGQLEVGGNKVWNAGNDGSGSGLDADLLDGNHASAFYLATNPSGYTTNTGTIVENGTTFSGTYPVYFRVAANNAYSHPNITFTGSTNTLNVVNIAPSGTVDGRNISVDGTKLDGIAANANNYSLPATPSVTGINIGSEVNLAESTDRADLLQITSSTSTWAGLQIRNSSNEGRWSFMTDGAQAGFYDDENSEWAVLMAENGAVNLYHNNVLRLNTLSDGVDVSGTLYVDDKIVHNGDPDTYTEFHTGNQWRVVCGGTERFEVNTTDINVAANLQMNSHYLDMNNNDIYGVDQIFHEGDTDTYMQFHAADQWRVVTGGAERLEVNNSQITSTEPIHAPSFHGDGSALTGLNIATPLTALSTGTDATGSDLIPVYDVSAGTWEKQTITNAALQGPAGAAGAAGVNAAPTGGESVAYGLPESTDTTPETAGQIYIRNAADTGRITSGFWVLHSQTTPSYIRMAYSGTGESANLRKDSLIRLGQSNGQISYVYNQDNWATFNITGYTDYGTYIEFTVGAPFAYAGGFYTSASPKLIWTSGGVNSWTSGDNTWAAGGTYTLSHSLGVMPKAIQVELVCVTANWGYSVGDVHVLSSGEKYANWGVALINVDSTTIKWGVYSNGIWFRRESFNSSGSMLNSQWRVRLTLIG